MTENNSEKAHAWSYPRHRYFDWSLQQAGSSWFKEKGFAVQGRYPHIPSHWNEWPRNILLPEVVAYVKGPRGLVPFLTALVPEAQQDKIRGVTIQDVVQAIKESGRQGGWIGEFERKYGMMP